MIKIMLVDDEPLIRMAMKNLFNWKENGFEIIAEASNGEMAILKIKDNLPDIIITDIKMPVKSGTELIQYVKKSYPQIKCVVLSNYDDFDYVKDALMHGAVDYILKSDLNNENFANIINKVKSKFFSDNNPSIKESEIERKVDNKEKVLLLRTQLLKEVIYGKIPNKQEIGNISLIYGINLKDCRFYLCTVCIDNSQLLTTQLEEKDYVMIKNTITELIEETFGFSGFYFSEGFDKYVMLMYNSHKGEEVFREKVTTFLSSLEANISRFLNLSVTIGISGLGRKIEDIPETYEQSMKAVKSRFYEGYGKMHYFNSIHNKVTQNELSQFLKESIKDIRENLHREEWTKVKEFFTSLFSLIIKTRYNEEKVKRLAVNLLFLIQGERMEEIFENDEEIDSNQELFNKIMKCDLFKQVETIVLDHIKQLERRCNVIRTNRYSSVVCDALEYINRNYEREDITLISVAEEINVNPSYLSRLFFKETNIHFTEYLTKLRIEKAKEFLIEHRYNVNEIAEKIGYSNPKYFIQIFKRVVGVTPSGFRMKK